MSNRPRVSSGAGTRPRGRVQPTRTQPSRTQPTRTEDERLRDRLILSATLLLTFLVYARSLGNGFIDFDDPESVVENLSIREFSAANLAHWVTTPLQYMYTPLVYFSFAVDYQFGGIDSSTYHFTNLLLHLINTGLVYLVVRGLVPKAFVAHAVTVAFAIHPMNVDSVAWISTRSNLLFTAFTLGALLVYLRYLRGARWWHIPLISLLFLCATLSKSAAVVLPLSLLLVDYLKGRTVSWRLLVEKTPLFAIAIVMGIVALTVRVDTISLPNYIPTDRFFLVTTALVVYLVKLVFPFGLSLAYEYPRKTGAFLPWYMYASPIVLALIGYGLWRIRTARRIVVFGVGFFLVNILLSQAVLLIDNYHANRYAYLAYLGLYLILADFADRGLAAFVGSWRAALAGVLAVVVVLLSALSFVRNGAWKNTETIMTASIEAEPGVPFLYNSRGIARFKSGDYAAARRDFEKTLELDPTFALSYYYLGAIKHAEGDHTGALADFDKVMAAYPAYAAGFNERGKVKLALGDRAGALADFTAATSLDSYLANAFVNRGRVQVELGNHADAMADLNHAIELDPSVAEPFYYRGTAKFALGDTAGACADWSTASSLGYPEATHELTARCGGAR